MKHILFIALFSFCINSIAQVPGQHKSRDISGDPDIVIDVSDASSNNASAGYYQKNGKYGFVYPDNKQQEAIYDEIRLAQKNFIVKKGGKYGFADIKGNVIGKIEFDSIGSNSYMTGDALIVKKNGRYGIIADGQKLILSIKYDKILYSGTQNPVSFVRNKNGSAELIFNQQEKPFPQKVDYAEVYANLTILKVNGKFGVVKNETIIPFEYDSIFVSMPEGYNNGAKPKKGKKANPFAFEYSKAIKNVNCLTVQKGNKFGLIDSDGNVIYPADNDLVSSVEIKKYYTVKKNNLVGIYFMETKKKTEIEFGQVYADGIGYVMADKNKKAGVFNIKGEQIIPFEYDSDFIGQYNFGLGVTKDKKKGFTDRKGKLIIPPLYDDVDTFYESGFSDFIKVKLDEKYGVINLKNEWIIPANFEWIGAENGFFKAVMPGAEKKFGLYDKTGKLVVPVEYRWITHSDTEDSKITILVKDGNSYNFLNEKTELIFPENVSQYGYVLNHDKLLNPLSPTRQFLLFVKDKKGKCGMLNEMSGVLDIPMVYDEIIQRFGTEKHTYYSVRNGKKFGLINEKNQEIIPLKYDAINGDLIDANYNDENDKSYSVIVTKGNKFGTINLQNEVQIPFQYKELERISGDGLYKAKTGKHYQIINAKNEVLNQGPFDEVSNFEEIDSRKYGGTGSIQALTFYNGKMKVINNKGKLVTAEVTMLPHKGYKTFDELKFALVQALDSQNDSLLKDFADKIAPSEHILYYLKENPFDHKPLEYNDINYIKERYYTDLLRFKRSYWNGNSGLSYNHNSLTSVTDYTLLQDGYVTNERNIDHAFGSPGLMEKVLRDSFKINGFWISSYFMTRHFNRL